MTPKKSVKSIKAPTPKPATPPPPKEVLPPAPPPPVAPKTLPVPPPVPAMKEKIVYIKEKPDPTIKEALDKSIKYKKQLKEHEALIKAQKEQIDRIEKMHMEILTASKSPPQKTYIYNEQQASPQNEFKDMNAKATLEKSNKMLEKINEQTAMLNKSIENIDESQRQFLNFIKTAEIEPPKVKSPKSAVNIDLVAPYTTDDDY